MHKEKIAKGATKGQMQVNVQYSGIKWGKEKRKKWSYPLQYMSSIKLIKQLSLDLCRLGGY